MLRARIFPWIGALLPIRFTLQFVQIGVDVLNYGISDVSHYPTDNVEDFDSFAFGALGICYDIDPHCGSQILDLC